MATQIKHLTSKNWFPINERTPVFAQHLNAVIDQVNTVLSGEYFDLGVIDCSGNPNYPSMTEGQYYHVSVAGKIGGGSGIDVEVMDTIYCLTDCLGGTEAAVGTNYTITQVNIDPATVAELRTGTANAVYVTPKTLKDQGMTTAAATIIALAGGTTEQLKLTATADQKALTIASTLQSGTGLLNITSTVADGALRMASIGTSMSTAFTSAKTLSEFYATHTNAATDVTGAVVVGYDDAKICTALSKASLTGFRSVFSGTATPAAGTSNYMGLDIRPTITLNAAGTNLYGVYMDFSGATNTASSSTAGLYINASSITNNLIYGAQIFNANAAVYLADRNAANGILVDIDKISAASSWYGVNITKDLTNATAAGVLAVTNNALKIEQSIASSALASGAVRAANNVTEINFNGASAVANLDLYTGTALKIGFSATTTAAGTAVANGTGILIDYDLTETAGTLTQQTTNVMYIDYDTVGTVEIANGAARNLFYINATDAGVVDYGAGTSTLSGMALSLSSVGVASANLTLYGVNVTLPAALGAAGVANKYAFYATGGTNTIEVLSSPSSNAYVGINVVMQETTSIGGRFISDLADLDNNLQGIVVSRDITGALTASRAYTGYATTFAQEGNNSSALDFNLTDGANTGVQNIILSHTTTATSAGPGVLTIPDEFRGTALCINIAGTTSDANTKLNMTARALDIVYATTQTTGVFNLNATDVARIDVNVDAGTVIGDVGGSLNFLFIDGDGFVPGATVTNATAISALKIDLSSASVNDAQASLYGIYLEMPAADHSATAETYGIKVIVPVTSDGAIYTYDGANGVILGTGAVGIDINSNTSDAANALVCLNVSKDITLTAAAAGNAAVTDYAARLGIVLINNDDGGFDITCATDAVRIDYVLDNNATTVATADTLTGSALSIAVDSSCVDDANSVILTHSAGAINVPYTITQVGAGAINVAAFNIVNVNYDTVGTPAIAAGTYNFYNLDATDAGTPAVAATATMTGYKASMDTLKVTDADLVLYGFQAHMPNVGTSTQNAFFGHDDARVARLVTNTVAGYFTEGVTVLNICNGAEAIATDGYIYNTKNAGAVGAPAAGTITAKEYGDGRHHITVLTLTAARIGAVAAAALAIGQQIYELPAGVQFYQVTDYRLAFDNDDASCDADDPLVGIGSVVGAGAVFVLNGTPAFMDYMTEVASVNCDGTYGAIVGPVAPTAGFAVGAVALNAVGAEKSIFLNCAETWTGTTNITATGTITLVWDTME